jgi:hypothetical protein|tara:strand:- start:1381 stop:1908 length:528 start_codon:yes stop_codon:yes gene_type:complete
MDLQVILIFLIHILASVLIFVTIIMLIAFAMTMTRKILKLRKPRTTVPQETKEKRMSKEKGEGVTFNDIFMFMIAVPLVLLWVGFAGFVIHSGLNDSSVLDQIEGYTTLIAILGGPALLIIKDALDVWKQEQAEKTAFYKVKAQAVIDYNDSMQKQAQMIESKAQEQEHKMESKK